MTERDRLFVERAMKRAKENLRKMTDRIWAESFGVPMNLPKKPKFDVLIERHSGPSNGMPGSGKSESIPYLSQEQFNKWYDETFAGAVEVYSPDNYLWSIRAAGKSERPDTETALLINIQPIKEETAEDILREMLGRIDQKRLTGTISLEDQFERARKLLERKK